MPQGVTNGSSKGQGGAPGEVAADATSDLLLAQEVGGVSPLVVLSIAFLIAGLGLFVAALDRAAPRRLTGGPVLEVRGARGYT